MKLGPYSI